MERRSYVPLSQRRMMSSGVRRPVGQSISSQAPNAAPLVTSPAKTSPQNQQSVIKTQAPPQRPRPISYKLPSAAELAALTKSKNVMQTRPRPVQRSNDISQESSLNATSSGKPTFKPSAQPKVVNTQPINKSQLQQSRHPAVSASAVRQPRHQPATPLFEQVVANEKTKDASKKSRKIQFAFMGAGVIVFIVGIAVSIMGMRVNQQVAAQTQNTQVNSDQSGLAGNGDDPVPDEAVVGNGQLSSHIVAPEAPRKLLIPKLKVESRVFGLGTKPSGELLTPGNIFDTGWYTSSAKPGKAGATLIDGHVHGPTKPGVFANLKKLNKEDTIIVERGNGTKVTYKVVKTQVYDADNTDMKAAMTPVEDGKSGLNLITCTGKLDKSTNTYKERLIVFATIVE